MRIAPDTASKRVIAPEVRNRPEMAVHFQRQLIGQLLALCSEQENVITKRHSRRE